MRRTFHPEPRIAADRQGQQGGPSRLPLVLARPGRLLGFHRGFLASGGLTDGYRVVSAQYDSVPTRGAELLQETQLVERRIVLEHPRRVREVAQRSSLTARLLQGSGALLSGGDLHCEDALQVSWQHDVADIDGSERDPPPLRSARPNARGAWAQG